MDTYNYSIGEECPVPAEAEIRGSPLPVKE